MTWGEVKQAALQKLFAARDGVSTTQANREYMEGMSQAANEGLALLCAENLPLRRCFTVTVEAAGPRTVPLADLAADFWRAGEPEAYRRREDGRLMGSVGLTTDSARTYGSSRSLGYALGVHYWGQGYMTEAVRAVIRFGFETMGLDVISATCYPDNPASRRVLEKCGFRYEGMLHRAELLYNGAVKDHLHFYLTHEMAGFAGGEWHTDL